VSRGKGLLFFETWRKMGLVVNAMPRPHYPGKEVPYPVPTLREAGWATGSVWTGAGSPASTGIRSPDSPARSIRSLSCAMVETRFSIYNETFLWSVY